LLTSNGDAWLRSVTYPNSYFVDSQGNTQTRSQSWVKQEFDQAGRLKQINGGTGPDLFGPVNFDWRGGTYLGRSHVWSNTADPLVGRRQFDALGRPLRWSWRTVQMDPDGSGQPTSTSWGEEYCGGTWRSECADPLLEIDVVRDKMGRIGSLQWSFGHPFLDEQRQVQSGPSHATPWRGYKYDSRGALQTVWEHEGESTVVDTSGVSAMNHDLTGSDIESLGSGYGEKSGSGSGIARSERSSRSIWSTPMPPTGGSRRPAAPSRAPPGARATSSKT
jgi:hypothetical protein